MELFATCGAGLEPFVQLELRRHLNTFFQQNPTSSGQEAVDVQFATGKVFFPLPSESDTDNYDKLTLTNLIRNLKVVERLFGVILHENEVPQVKTIHDLLNYLYKLVSSSEVKEKLDQWRTRLCILSEKEAKPEATPAKKPRLDVGFRVNVKVTGRFRRLCNNPHSIAKCIGSAIAKNFVQEQRRWFIDLRQPDVELSLYLTDSGILLAIPLTKKPLSERTYLKHIPLRSTVASAMNHLLIRHLDTSKGTEDLLIIADPMCGTATILVELSRNYNSKFMKLYGMDISSEQLVKAQENIGQGRSSDIISLVKGDARKKYPWKDFLDGIVCDLPFGQQHGNSQDEVKTAMPSILSRMDESLRVGGIIVLLFTAALTSFLEETVNTSVHWKMLEKFPVKLGELHANIFAFKK